MKKMLLIGLCFSFFVSCASLKESEFMEHRAMYKNFDHAVFSIKNAGGTMGKFVTTEDITNSQEQGWWGIQIP